MSAIATAEMPVLSSMDDDSVVAPAKESFSTRITVVFVLLAIATALTTGLVAAHVVPAPGANPDSTIVYRIDRRTGQMSFCSSTKCAPVVIYREDGEGP
jgi:hypothetical protein